MKKARVLLLTTLLLTTLLLSGVQAFADPLTPAITPSNDGKPYIDVVFAIDCSGSMGPVIETAKKKVWTIVNQIAKAEPAPILRIGLIGYGDADRTYRIFPLSDDLDTVYKNLMTFKDEGWSDEYVGLTVHKAVAEMPWSGNGITLKIIYVVGNETARQGPNEFDYTKTAADAWRRDILVNAIYCNARSSRLPQAQRANALPNAPNNPVINVPTTNAPRTQAPTGTTGGVVVQNVTPRVVAEPNAEVLTWMEMAQVGKGQFLEISNDANAITIATPFDKDLVELNKSLNATYIPFGRAGIVGAANQAAQDTNAATVGGAVTLAARAYAKSSSQYNNRRWDLVDASKEKDFDWAKLKEEDLPEVMRPMNLEQRKAYVANNTKQRGDLQLKIREIGDKRDAYIQEQIKKQGIKNEDAFDEAVRRSLTQQAAAKGFRFKK